MIPHEALNWLDSFERFGMKLDLSNIQTLLEALGNPQKKLRAIHVAGTNGKGSTCAMIASVLQEAGYAIGLYTSPHLISPRERIQKNHEWISEGDFVTQMILLRDVVETLNQKSRFSPTYFELMTALALNYFAKHQIDFVVLETGMGGRLDATNIVESHIQVITNIDLEHTRYLGKTIEEIAWEKSGIIKPHSSVITGATGVALAVITQKVRSQKASLIQLGRELSYEVKGQALEGQLLKVRTLREDYDIHLGLLGVHQAQNCSLAIGALEALRNLGHTLPKEAIVQGLKKACWPGRFEILQTNPLIILDAAHNPAGAIALVKTWKAYLGQMKGHLVFSALEDKDVKAMAQDLSEIIDEVDLIQLSNRLAAKQFFLKETWKNLLPEGYVREANIEQVVERLQQNKDSNKPILVAGSIYLLGEFLKNFKILL